MRSGQLSLALVGVGLIAFIGTLMETALNVTLPIMMTQFSVSLTTVQWLTTGYLLVSSWMMIINARLVQRYSLRSLLGVGTGGFLVSLVICSLAPSFPYLFGGRILSGVCMGICIPLLFTVITRYAPRSRLGFFMAVGVTITALAPALGPTYGGIVLRFFNWRWIFLLSLPLVLGGWLLALVALPREQINAPNQNFDIKGFVWLVLLLTTFQLLVTSGGRKNELIFILLLVLCGGMVSGCWRHIQRQPQPVLAATLFTNQRFGIYFTAYFILQAVNVALGGFLIPNFLQLVWHQSAFIAGSAMLPGLLIRIGLMPLAGKWFDHLNHKGLGQHLIYGGTTVVGVSMLILGHLAHGSVQVGLLVGVYVLYNAGLALAISNLMTTSIQAVATTETADANALLNTAQQYSGGIGIALVAALINRQGVPAGFYWSLVGLALGIAAVIFLVISGRKLINTKNN